MEELKKRQREQETLQQDVENKAKKAEALREQIRRREEAMASEQGAVKGYTFITQVHTFITQVQNVLYTHKHQFS